jgi:enoyl-CoA hydratase/carnithine racemase
MIEFQCDGAVATLTVNRPARKNAFDEAMWRALRDACDALASGYTTEHAAGTAGGPRVLLLQGQPGIFCAGADIEEMTRLVGDPAALAASNTVVAQAQLALERLPLPSVALIDGPCFGGGFGLAAACDFRLGTPRSLFAVTPARLGLLYSIEDTRRVLGLLGASRTRRLLLRSERLDAATALGWGVLDAVVEPDALATTGAAWAAGLAAQSPTSLAGIKATLGLLQGQGVHDEAAVRALFDSAFTGKDFDEGAAAFLQRRAPHFGA